MYNEKVPAPDCGMTVARTEIGYGERILSEIQEMRSLAERIQSKTFEIAGTCVESNCGSDAKEREPHNFCEHTLNELAKLRRVLHDALDNLGSM